jgi:uncharacterized Zn finger protein (UPF0148 family)
MFEEMSRTLRQLDGVSSLSVSIPSDADGYFDRECPSDECLFQFKVHEDDWRDKVRDEQVFCPFCGHTADAQKWWTQEQIKHAEQVALAQIGGRLQRAMKRDADRWSRAQPRNSLISVSMKVDSRPMRVPLPPSAAEPMQLKIQCPACTCRYAVIGAAFFCPACGHSAVEQVFERTLTGIRRTIDALETVRAAIADRDSAESTVRLIVENALQCAVTAFQRYAEALYARWPSVSKPRRNAFQSLGEGTDLWRAATGKDYADYVGADDMKILKRGIQQRHLLAHTQGLVDQDYISRSGDSSYRLGQRIVVREAAVRDVVDSIEKLATAMRRELPPD